MSWFIRFLAGHRARPRDVVALRRDLPELTHWRLPEIPPREEALRRLRELPWPYPSHPHLLAEALAAWAHDAMSADESLAVTRDSRECPISGCPLRAPATAEEPERRAAEAEAASGAEAAADGGPSTTGTAEPTPAPEALVQRFLQVGGGPGRGTPLKRFLDLVRKVHARAGVVTQVIVTDPYVFSGTGESGAHDGFENFVSYLEALPRPSPRVGFELLLPPNPKRGGSSRDGWQRSVAERVPGVRFNSYSPRLNFHDRFYLAAHDREPGLRGVFGPSLNGLGADDIVLMGPIDDPAALNTFARWFL